MLCSGVNSACDLWRMERPLASVESCDFITTAVPRCSTGNVSVGVCEWRRAQLGGTAWSCTWLTIILVFQDHLWNIFKSLHDFVTLCVANFIFFF